MGRAIYVTMLFVEILFLLWAWQPPAANSLVSEERNPHLYLPLVGADWRQLDYRQEMRSFVQGISKYAERVSPGFLIIPQNGQELLTLDGEANGPLAVAYVAAIDGAGREDLFYGYDDDNVPTPTEDREYLLGFTDLAEALGIEVLVTDYCWTRARVDDSYAQSDARGYISFAADHRELDNVPAYPVVPHDANADDVISLLGARNFLYLINPGAFSSKAAFLQAFRATDHDLLIVDAFFDDVALTAGDIASLGTKANGGKRLALAYLSIGEAEDYRYYWQEVWGATPPNWLGDENPDWPGNYKVMYWDPDWQAIIYGNRASYLKRILDAGFDGVYLDLIDAFEHFER